MSWYSTGGNSANVGKANGSRVFPQGKDLAICTLGWWMNILWHITWLLLFIDGWLELKSDALCFYWSQFMLRFIENYSVWINIFYWFHYSYFCLFWNADFAESYFPSSRYNPYQITQYKGGDYFDFSSLMTWGFYSIPNFPFCGFTL